MMTSSVEDNWPWEFGSHLRRSASGDTKTKKPKAEQETAQPTAARFNKNRGAVVNRALKKRGYLHCLRNVTFLPFSKYTKKGVSDYILCIARV